ncbi:hypothetical protein [Sphingobacterium sp.]|jgi:transposase-like protein|uniref:hypothetical protein n=1 Tax=Sphingobacterium sp. TaxID=341027 RepID=UPI00289F20C9|nr:hypothetical protein [Sphingobacterium sp.]
MRKYPKDIKLEAVRSIVSGELFLEEVMLKYDIKNSITVIRWIRSLLPEVKKDLAGDTREGNDDLKVNRNDFVYEIYKKISDLEEHNRWLNQQRDYLIQRIVAIEEEGIKIDLEMECVENNIKKQKK